MCLAYHEAELGTYISVCFIFFVADRIPILRRPLVEVKVQYRLLRVVLVLKRQLKYKRYWRCGAFILYSLFLVILIFIEFVQEVRDRSYLGTVDNINLFRT
jgi:hypothetical protein